jgi:hypothetical protein
MGFYYLPLEAPSSQLSEADVQVRITKWPIRNCPSLADVALSNDVYHRYIVSIESLEKYDKEKNLYGLTVSH